MLAVWVEPNHNRNDSGRLTNVGRQVVTHIPEQKIFRNELEKQVKAVLLS